MAVTDTPIDSEESFARSAGKQLAIYALYALVLLASLIYVFSLVAGRTGSGTSGGAVDVANNSVTTTLRQEPPQLDAGRSTDASSFVVLAHVMEGLLAYDDNMQLIPGMAERWEVREDGATFWIRDEALWSNGDSVTAHDFEFAWKRVVDPDTASEYAFILYPILNAEAITQGELPKEMLGVQAVDDQTLEVQFAQPTPYFDKLVAFNTYLPLQQEFYESTDGRYGADAEYMIYNGPYVVEEWIHGASMLWRKNPTYWGDHKGFLDEINAAYITTDINAKLNLFKDGQIAETQLLAPMLPEAMEKRWQIDRVMDGTVFFLEFNHREGRITDNWHFRRAMQLAQSSDELVYKVLKEAAYLPAVSLFPVWIQGLNDIFRTEYPPIEHKLNVQLAREHLEMARQELGLEEFPPIVFLTGDTPISILSSEYYQELYKQNLGLEIRIDVQNFKQRLAKMTSGEFDVVVAGWGPDYDDPLTFGDFFASWNLNNRGRYNSPEMDAQVRIAQAELDPKKRLDAFGEIQRIVYEDVTLIPMYERGWAFVVDPRLKGFKRRSVGPEVDFNFAYIEEVED
ncbi:MAG: peptide ABC transporter substrate-binding protein [Gammaproteobacteria bacterium]|jgi:oligopeptide transport system substrate-binding protein|nr:peptide ABC transporter substrate-binding protein [Gammaproteobacteria bacterium]MBT3859324.1 peptide ABC transporter substrate-binding protein [Gammaproteobacteria bacterium]MBT3988014.1 peptide ABC transporter substrate-binding protein [Gammaproteobacteria bacterium]MBT4255784.1 peptide ABC transporter substrate-binding protein [Gammaproteobacteria bacterium]MBT4583103.1 peptide ABC transporter substrate-binding protein [Gammaproteobacteria bacterium]